MNMRQYRHRTAHNARRHYGATMISEAKAFGFPRTADIAGILARSIWEQSQKKGFMRRVMESSPEYLARLDPDLRSMKEEVRALAVVCNKLSKRATQQMKRRQHHRYWTMRSRITRLNIRRKLLQIEFDTRAPKI